MADAWWLPSMLEKPRQIHDLVQKPTPIHEQRAKVLRLFAQRQAASATQALLARGAGAGVSAVPGTHMAVQPSTAAAAPLPRAAGAGMPCWRDCCKAFLQLYKELLPDLSASALPHGQAWAHVSREWPSEPDMLVQYKEFRAMVQKRASREPDWFASEHAIVCAWHPVVHAVLQRATSEPRPACLILAYVGSYPAWCVGPDSVAPWPKSNSSAVKRAKHRPHKIVVVLSEESRLRLSRRNRT